MSEKRTTNSNEIIPSGSANWQPKVLIIFGVGGALVGLLAAYIFIQNAEDAEEAPKFTAGKGLRIGLLLLGLIRNIADLA